MNQYEVTFTNGEVVVIAAGTAEAAQAIADENADLYGCVGLSAVSAMLLDSAVAGPTGRMPAAFVSPGRGAPCERRGGSNRPVSASHSILYNATSSTCTSSPGWKPSTITTSRSFRRRSAWPPSSGTVPATAIRVQSHARPTVGLAAPTFFVLFVDRRDAQGDRRLVVRRPRDANQRRGGIAAGSGGKVLIGPAPLDSFAEDADPGRDGPPRLRPSAIRYGR